MKTTTNDRVKLYTAAPRGIGTLVERLVGLSPKRMRALAEALRAHPDGQGTLDMLSRALATKQGTLDEQIGGSA